MSPDEAYQIGFLAGCADSGIGDAEAVALYRKTAHAKQALGGIGTLVGAVAGPTAAPRERKMEGLGHGVAQGFGWDVGGGLGAGGGIMLGALLSAAMQRRGLTGNLGAMPTDALAVGGLGLGGYLAGGALGRHAVGAMTGPAPWSDESQKQTAGA